MLHLNLRNGNNAPDSGLPNKELWCSGNLCLFSSAFKSESFINSFFYSLQSPSPSETFYVGLNTNDLSVYIKGLVETRTESYSRLGDNIGCRVHCCTNRKPCGVTDSLS